MGIEPTNRMISIRPDGFEDRARHQPWIHFHTNFASLDHLYLYTATLNQRMGCFGFSKFVPQRN